MAKKNQGGTSRTLTDVSSLVVSEITSVGSIALKPKKTAGTNWQPLLDKLSALKPGQQFTIAIPKDIDKDLFASRFGSARQNRKVKAPAGAKHRVSLSADEKYLVVQCLAAPAPTK